MLKFRDIGTYKNAVNFGYLTSEVELKNGKVVTYDLKTKLCALPTTGKEANLAIVMNNIDKPEIAEPNQFVIAVGENPRIFTLKSLENRIIDVDMDQVKTAFASISENDTLVADTDGKLKKVSAVTDYKAYFKVVEKTGFNGEGLALEVVIA